MKKLNNVLRLSFNVFSLAFLFLVSVACTTTPKPQELKPDFVPLFPNGEYRQMIEIRPVKKSPIQGAGAVKKTDEKLVILALSKTHQSIFRITYDRKTETRAVDVYVDALKSKSGFLDLLADLLIDVYLAEYSPEEHTIRNVKDIKDSEWDLKHRPILFEKWGILLTSNIAIHEWNDKDVPEVFEITNKFVSMIVEMESP